MRNASIVLALALVVLSFSAVTEASAQENAPSSLIPPGRYEGSLNLGGGKVTPIVLRILEDGGGLVDLPGQSLYGFPLSGLVTSGGRIAFTMGADAADGSGGALRFDARVSDPSDPSGPLRLEGTFSRANASGPFSLVWSPPPASDDQPFSVAVRGGRLRGSLLLPAGKGPFPLVVIVGGAGATDRDGNNYNVPGRNDGVKALAAALRGLGVATCRYDKRGAGESYALEKSEADLSFDDYVDDAAALISRLRRDARFSRLVVAGHTEGGLVAASAVRRLSAGDGTASVAVDGLALLCASGRTPVEIVEASLADAPAELKGEARSIMDSLRAGKPWADPSPYFADFFRPSFQPYLISWFRHDLKADISAWKGALLIVQGNADFQVTLAEAAILAQARPDAAAVVLPGMNHVLKEVPMELDENYRSFSDPSYPLARGLAELLAAFAKGDPLPLGLSRFDGGIARQGR
jgi:hypothetical protein